MPRSDSDRRIREALREPHSDLDLAGSKAKLFQQAHPLAVLTICFDRNGGRNLLLTKLSPQLAHLVEGGANLAEQHPTITPQTGERGEEIE
jgi:hypothetical protein